MAKILILANYDLGLYKFRKELLSELVKENTVYISLPYGEHISLLEEIGCIFIDTPIERRGINPLTDAVLLTKYIKILKKVKPDVVLTYTIKPNVFGGIACRVCKIPLIANITGLGTSIENGGFLQKVTLLLNKIALKEAKCVFVQNEANESFLIKKSILNGHHRLIPGSGVNLDDYTVLEYPPDKNINFLFIARVMKEKGIDQYLDSAEYIKQTFPNTTFHVLGFCEGDYIEKLTDLDKKGIIKYHGMQSDIKKFHEISHCTIHPSYYPEGISNVLLESAACGRPIITTNKSGCREIVDDGITGFIVEEKNSKDLINKIESFILLDRKDKRSMGTLGREKVSKEFDRKFVIEAYIQEIKKLEMRN